MSDAALARRARDGDTEALVALYRRYVREIYGYLYNQVGNGNDAEDITSETFLRVVRGLGEFGGRSSFRTWVYAIARNCLRDHWRQAERLPSATLDLERAQEVDAEAALEARPEVTELGQAVLERLPPNYRSVVKLRILDGRSVRDTAEALNVSEGNVKVIQHRALKRAAEIATALTSEDQP